MRNFRALPLATLLLATTPALAASVEKSIELRAPADKVWAIVGAFCSIKDWHPAIGECREANDVRTLTTKDGKGQFVEKQTDRDDKAKTYSYEIEKSPLPITEYKSTLKVVPRGDDSTVQWSANYTPVEGQAQAAEAAINSIYQAGLDNIAKMSGR